MFLMLKLNKNINNIVSQSVTFSSLLKETFEVKTIFKRVASKEKYVKDL